MDTEAPGYTHTQKAPLCLFVYGTAIALLIGAWFAQGQPTIALALTVGGIVTAVVATAFHHLTVMDLGESLAVRFGPLPLPMFRMSIPYDDIQSVEVGRTLLLDGLGIHRSPRGGWVWNIWGRDCVVVHRRNGVLRIGTDDADNLARFLEGKITQQGG
jgi:hypothetical protein